MITESYNGSGEALKKGRKNEMNNRVSDWSKDSEVHFHFDNIYLTNPQQHDAVILYQAGDLHGKPGYKVQAHEQICYEISLVVSGKGSFTIAGERYELEEGDIVLNVPGELHQIDADCGTSFRYYYAGFNFDLQGQEEHPFVHIKKMFDHSDCRIVKNKLRIDIPFSHLLSELINLKNYSSYMIGMYLQQLIVISYRSFYESWEKSYKQDSSKKNGVSLVYEVINYIDLNLEKIRELSRIAEELHYSYSYMSHTFSKEVGLTIQEYYNRKRFEKAVYWLQQGELSITEIAAGLSYQSIHAFSKAFRKNFGISPTEYQQLTDLAGK